MTLSVVGAGLGRTGTLSLKLALEAIGFGPCYHMMEVFKNPAAPAYWAEAAQGGGPGWETIFEGYKSTVDWPSATFYRQLAEAYPRAKVILTERDPEAWFASTQATIFRTADRLDPDSPFERMFRSVIGRMFDQRMHDKDHLISVFRRHNAQVRETIPPERLLVYFAADGWGPLCDFLGAPVPDTPMPKVNSTEEFQSRVAARAQDAAEGR
jgi:hypothetical protein